MLGLGGAEAMIEGRNKVERYQGSTVDTETDNAPGIALEGCQGDQHAQAGYAKSHSQAVQEAVGELFTEGVRRCEMFR